MIISDLLNIGKEETVDVPHLLYILKNNREKLFELKESKVLFDYILKHKTFLKPDMSDENGKIEILQPEHIHHILYFFIHDYFRQTKDVYFDEKIYRKYYVEKELYYLAHKSKFLALCPLFNFQMDDDEIKINSRMKIRKITDNEKEEYEFIQKKKNP